MLHQRDEVYIVVAGSAHYKVDMITAVGPGDLLFAVDDGIAVATVSVRISAPSSRGTPVNLSLRIVPISSDRP
jgi:hypothetical protein